MNEGDLAIRPGVVIPEEELHFSFTRAGGPGGQHVNTSSTAVELTWDMSASASVTDAQRQRITEKLPSYVDSRGTLHIVAMEHRSQRQNREAAITRFVALLRRALYEAPPRRPTAPSRGARENRLQSKKRRGETKRTRRLRPDDL